MNGFAVAQPVPHGIELPYRGGARSILMAKHLLKRCGEFCMRLLMILGGLIGFTIGISLGIAHGTSWPHVLWRSSVAAFLSGLLFRWWGAVWFKSLRAAQQEHEAAARAAHASPARQSPKP